MTVVERLAELRLHLRHLRKLRTRVGSAAGFPRDLTDELERLPGFRGVLIHEYVAIDLDRVVAAMDDLGPIESFADRLADHLKESS